MTNTQCPACNRLPSVVRCNAHRTESVSAGVLHRARDAGYSGSNPLAAEQFIGARPVHI